MRYKNEPELFAQSLLIFGKQKRSRACLSEAVSKDVDLFDFEITCFANSERRDVDISAQL